MPEHEPSGPNRREVLKVLAAAPLMGNFAPVVGKATSAAVLKEEIVNMLIEVIKKDIARDNSPARCASGMLAEFKTYWMQSAREGNADDQRYFEDIIRRTGLADLPETVTHTTWGDVMRGSYKKITDEKAETRLLIAQILQSIIARKSEEEPKQDAIIPPHAPDPRITGLPFSGRPL